MLKEKYDLVEEHLNTLESDYTRYDLVDMIEISYMLANKEEMECSVRINELEEKLQSFGMFLRAHRSFLVNMDYIQTLTTHSLIMENGAKIPIPREKYAQVKQTYMEYVFRAKDSVVIGN